MVSDQNTQERLRKALADRYAIQREIGVGGMATVYLAQDLKHDRRVAVKVLKPELAAVVGTDRFLAEIRTTANLSHPHILPLHDSGEADGLLFYVMPYVDGESLAQKLDRESQLSVEEAVSIAGKVADALDSAHRHGVIHRDLKPANILFQEGEPVVADFGIALAVTAAGEGRLTETGLSLGTPYYMSPEQATGDQTPAAASDVYSLGCVLYEMLTGDPPHTGSTAQAILGKILLGEVTPPTKLRRTIPANVEGAVLKALERLPADRFPSTGKMAAALKDKGFRHGADARTPEAGPWKGLAIGLGVSAVLAVLVAVVAFLALRPPAPQAQRYEIRLVEHSVPMPFSRLVDVPALAPDGSRMVYADTVGLESDWQFWVKEQGLAKGTPLPGTTGAYGVVFSPDGEWIAYALDREVFKRPIQGTGAVPVPSCVSASGLAKIAWMADGSMLCAQGANTLVRISEDGGASPDTVFVGPPGDSFLRFHSLPGGNALLAVGCPGGNCFPTSLYAVDLEAGTGRVLLDEVLDAWYVETGHVVWVRNDGAVFATPFDLRRLEMSGPHVPLFDGVQTDPFGAAMVVAPDGTVVYAQGEAAMFGDPRAIVWVDRQGRAEPVDPRWSPSRFSSLSLSPGGERLALDILGEDGRQIWVKELPDGPLTRLTTDAGTPLFPAWTPDGGTITFSMNKDGDFHLRSVPSDGRSVGAHEVLLDLDGDLRGAEYTPDGQGLVFQVGPTLAQDIGFMDLAADTVNAELLATEFNERGVALSPDGSWLAFVSDASGRDEVYVRPFPDVESGIWRVSRDGGTEPLWARNGRELFYRSGDNWMTAASYTTDPVFNVENRERLFDAQPFWPLVHRRSYDYADSGGRFVMVLLDPSAVGLGERVEPRLILIQNWFTELRERVGGEE